MADAVHEEQEPAADTYDKRDKSDPSAKNRQRKLTLLEEKCLDTLKKQGYSEEVIVIERYLNMRYQGTDNAIMVKEPEHPSSTLPYADDFRSHYLREFGFELEGRDILVDDYRVRAIVPGSNPPLREKVPPKGKPIASTTTKTYFESGWEDVPVYKCEEIEPGHEIPGPSIIVQSISTIVVETDCIAVVTSDGDIDISLSVDTQNKGDSIPSGKDVPMDHCDEIREDPVQLSIFSHRFMGIAEQMGRTLARTAISVNIKVRKHQVASAVTSK